MCNLASQVYYTHTHTHARPRTHKFPVIEEVGRVRRDGEYVYYHEHFNIDYYIS